MKVIKKRFRTLGSAYNLRPNCSLCNQTLQKNKAYDIICNDCFTLKNFNTPLTSLDSYHSISYVCENCPKEKCILCGGICDDNLSLSVNGILDFVEVNCYFHSDTIAYYFDPKTYLTYCDGCFINGRCPDSISLSDYNFYLENIGNFRELYVKYKKSICPERRVSLIPYSAQEVLDGIRFLIQMEEVRCEKHWEIGLCYDENFNVYCGKCEVNSLYSIPINNDYALPYLKNFIKNYSKTFSFECINKFILKLINEKLDLIPKGSLISLAILEGKKLLCNPDKSCRRCVRCFAKASTEKTRPIILQCNHIMCLKCVRLKSTEKCSIDDSPLDKKVLLINRNTKETLITIDKLSDTKNFQYKCSCSHVISQSDAFYAGGCSDCLFPYDYFLDYSQSIADFNDDSLIDKDKIIMQKDFCIENLINEKKRLEDKIDENKENYDKCVRQMVSERLNWDEERKQFLLKTNIYKNNAIKEQEHNFKLNTELQQCKTLNSKNSSEMHNLKTKIQELENIIANLSKENFILSKSNTDYKIELENEKHKTDEISNKYSIFYEDYAEINKKINEITKAQNDEKTKLDNVSYLFNSLRLLGDDLDKKMNSSCSENCGNHAKYICLCHNPNIYLCQDHGDKHLEDDHQVKPLFKKLNDKSRLNAYNKNIQENRDKVLIFFSNAMKIIDELNRVVNENIDRVLKGIMIMNNKGIPRDFDTQEMEVLYKIFEEGNLVQLLLDRFKNKL